MSLWFEDAVFLILRFALVREKKTSRERERERELLGSETRYPSIGGEQTILKYAWKSTATTHGMQTGMQNLTKL